jgi:hypothetical protein
MYYIEDAFFNSQSTQYTSKRKVIRRMLYREKIVFRCDAHTEHKRSVQAANFHVNPLTPELNPSAQRCLTRFLLGILLLELCISLTYA